jgi:hypothetical protein
MPHHKFERSEADRLVTGLFKGILRREAGPDDRAHWVAFLMAGGSPADITDAFIGCDEFRAQIKNRLFVEPGHFYSPVVDVASARVHLDALEARGLVEQLPGVGISREAMVAEWERLVPLMRDNPFPADVTPGFRYAFQNPAYSWGDGSVLHAMLRLHRPKRVIEIGSGWSSACTVDTVERYLDGNCRLTFIDPYPQLLRTLLGDTAVPVEILESPLQDVPLATFADLQAGDVLFIDSTHVLRTGSDVCLELLEILPRLPSGVVVHIHDVFWPFEYPRHWVLDENRSWNELYALRAFLIGNRDWRVTMFNHYFVQVERARIEASYPDFLKNPGGAMWLQRA